MIIRLMFCVLLMLLTPAMAGAREGGTVIIACDWDFAPYEFINTDGNSDGFNVDVIHAILKELGISHKFVMKARNQAVTAFKQHEADLLVDFRDRYTREPYYRTLNPLGYYQFVVAHRSDVQPISSIADLKTHGPIIVNSANDSVVRMTLGSAVDDINFEFHTSREALAGINSGDFRYFFWGEEPLKWKIKEYNINNITLTKFLFPANEIHIVGYDKQLIDDIDSQFARMQQSGEIDRIRDKWFHPERIRERTSPTVLYIALAVLVISAFVFMLYRVVRARVKAALRRNKDMETMMHRALSMGSYSVIVNDLKLNRVTNQHGHAVPDEGVTAEQMMMHIHPADREMMKNRSRDKTQINNPLPFTTRWNVGTPEKPEWIIVTGHSYPEFDEHGKPETIVMTSKDITEQKRKESEERELTSRYLKMFESSLLAMSFYDRDGQCLDLNKKMKELCGITGNENLEFFRSLQLFDTDSMRGDFTPGTTETFHVCQRMYYPKAGIDKYIELRVTPTISDDGQLLYYIVTARDVTAERNMYNELRKQSKALRETGETNRIYEKELRTLLENCNMYVWHSDAANGRISFSRSLHSEEFTETLEEYVNGMVEEEREEAMDNIRNIEAISGPFNVVHRFNHTPVTNAPTWFAVSGMPLRSSDGHLTGLFGIVRDVTTLMETQERLREETARAENSAMLKSTFLANMTHEIRTPLNAIVGFSDVLQMVDDPEQRKEFIRIIRNNCDMLLRLINDIFEASTMDIKPLAIEPKDVDFAAEFAVVCQSLAQRVQEPAVEFIVDNPYTSLRIRIDMGRMQQVITNFVTNAVKYTRKGHIRVGYIFTRKNPENPDIPGNPGNPDIPGLSGNRDVPQASGIYMYCEDTGTGIPKEQQKKVFDRFVKLNDFVQGTGLGLSICKSIAERSGGSIGVQSDGDGTGSTFWIWVPCHEMRNEE